jgi:hypothetical protein
MAKVRISLESDSARKQLLVPATITFGEREVGCVVLNLSARGACITLDVDAVTPPAFGLAIDGERGRRRCRVIWRIERRLGISFGADQREAATYDRALAE